MSSEKERTKVVKGERYDGCEEERNHEKRSIKVILYSPGGKETKYRRLVKYFLHLTNLLLPFLLLHAPSH